MRVIISTAALGAATLAGPAAASAANAATGYTQVCPPKAGQWECDSYARHLSATMAPKARAVATSTYSIPYTPAALDAAYNLPSSSTVGAGETVGIVDAYNDPTAEADLGQYRTSMGLSDCTTANGCFRQVNESGGTSLPATDAGWSFEISLDVQMVSAICPNCKIVLVEANSAEPGDLSKAVNTAVSLGARFVSNSYGGSEWSGETSYDASYDHPGVAITASTGDEGYGVQYPAASRYVTSVGGTSLTQTTSGRGWAESVWNNADGAPGSGCSAYEAKPSWQVDPRCSKRSVADVSAVADPETGVEVYDSTPYDGESGWFQAGGTSASSPIIAASYALAGTPRAGLNPALDPYDHRGLFYDITTGNDGSCGNAYFCTAKPGYDGPTGIGTPNGVGGLATPATPTGDITNRLTGRCVDDHAGLTTNGNKIDLYNCNGTAPQHWTIESNGSVEVYGKCLSVAGGSTANKAKVVLNVCNGSKHQQWAWKTNGEMVNVASGKCLDDPASSKVNGIQLDIYTCNGTGAQIYSQD
jgi:subtilase family serine protease